MTKRKLNLAELICQAIATVLLFIPGAFYWQHWEEKLINPAFPGQKELAFSMSVSFIHAAQNTFEVLPFIITALMLINIVLLIIYTFRDVPSKFDKFYLILPILSVFMAVLTAILAGRRDDYGYCAPINWLFYIELLFLLATVVLAFMRCSKRIKEAPSKVKIVENKALSDADELDKYKQLLDKGVITQEEFERKKHQLLGF